MKAILVASLAFVLSGCLSVPVTRTAANDEACLQQSVHASTIKPPVTASDLKVAPTRCETVGSTWSGVGAPENRRNEPAYPFGS